MQSSAAATTATTTNISNTKEKKSSSKHNDLNTNIGYCIDSVLVPREADILLGRGRGAQNHTGNVNYRYLIESFRKRYEKIPSKGAKTQLIREVVDCIYNKGGRFLKQDPYGRWIPVDPEVARDKVSHSFRNQKRLLGGDDDGDGGDDDDVNNNNNNNKRSRTDMKKQFIHTNK